MIYWDYNASAPLRPQVARLLNERLVQASAGPGNAASVHAAGRAWRTRLESARARIASVLGAEPKEICLTASGSEAVALALKGAFFARPDKSLVKVVTSGIEHPALLSALEQLKGMGAQPVQVSPGRDGRVRSEDILGALGPEVSVCSLMWANNETGVLQPVAEVARACRQRGILFHTDAVQAVGKVAVSLREVDADLLSLSAHKFGGPVGAGALVVRRGVDVEALTPGHQEGGRRGGSANVPFAEALALALELAAAELCVAEDSLGRLRDRLEREVLSRIPGTTVNGAAAPRVRNTSNLYFEGVDAESLLIGLDLAGICVSSGAACASGSLSPSHVLTAMGLSPLEAKSCLRLSLGSENTDAEVDRVLEALCAQVAQSRASGARSFG